MKVPVIASMTAAALLTAPIWAQTAKPSPYPNSSPIQYSSPDQYSSADQTQGVSHPPDEPIVTNDLEPTTPPAANPAVNTAVRSIRADQRTPGQPATMAGAIPVSSSGMNPATQQPRLVTRTATQTTTVSPFNPDEGVVTQLTAGPNQLPAGTILKVTLDQQLSSESTQAGAAFSGHVIDPVMKNGQIVIPVGAILAGRVTSVSSGRRITGGASIHLRPDEVFLPNGTRYYLHAMVYDVRMASNVKPGSEGDVVHVSHAKQTAAEAGLFGGGAAAAGFVAAGGPAALIAGGAAAGYVGVRWLLQDRQAVLPKDAEVIFGLTEPMNLVAFPTRAALTSR